MPTHRKARAISRCRPAGAPSTPPASAPKVSILIVLATSTPDYIFPSTAAVAAKLGGQGMRSFDVPGVLQRFRVRAGNGRQLHSSRAQYQRSPRIGAEVYLSISRLE